MQKRKDLAWQCKDCQHLLTMCSRLPYEESTMDCRVRHNIALEKAKKEVCPYRELTLDMAKALLFDLAKGIL